MRRILGAALPAVLLFLPQPAPAQRPTPVEERRISRLMDKLRDEMWDYRRDLDFFRRTPEYTQLVDLRFRLRGQAMRVAELERGGPRAQREQRELAREMRQTAEQLTRLTGRLEERTDLGAREDVRRRADRLKSRAEDIRRLIGRLDDLVR